MPNGQNAAAFDVEGARKAGYSDEEILAQLTQSRKFDVDGALKAGHSKGDVINYLAGTPRAGLNLPGGSPESQQAAELAPKTMKQAQAAMPKMHTVDSLGYENPWDDGGPSNTGELLAQKLKGASDSVGSFIRTRDQENLHAAASGQKPTHPRGVAGLAYANNEFAPRMLQTTIDKARGAVEHPVITAGILAANSNPVSGTLVDAGLAGYYGADAIDAGRDIATKGFTPENTGRFLDDAAITLPASAGAVGSWRAARDVPIESQNAAAQRGMRPAGKGQEQFQTDLEGARPYLGGRGISSQAEVQQAIPGAKSEIWQPYDNAMGRIENEQVNGPSGPTTFGKLEERRLEVSAQLHGANSKDPATLQTLLQQGKTVADLEAEQEAIHGILDPRLRQEGINPEVIRGTHGNVHGIERLLSGRNTLGEESQPYGFGRMWKDAKLFSPGSWFDAARAGAQDIQMQRPWFSGKPTDVDIKTGLLSGADKPSFATTTYPQPIGPQPGPPTPAPITPVGALPTVGFPTQPNLWAPPANASPQPGFDLPVRIDTSPGLYGEEAAAGARQDAMNPSTRGYPGSAYVEPIVKGADSLTLRGNVEPRKLGGQGSLAPRSSFGPPFEPQANAPITINPQKYFDPDRRTNTSLRDIVGPDPMRQQLVRRAQAIIDDPSAPLRDKAIAQAQIADIRAHPFERSSGESIQQMKAKVMKPMTRAEAEEASAKRSEGRRKRFEGTAQ